MKVLTGQFLCFHQIFVFANVSSVSSPNCSTQLTRSKFKQNIQYSAPCSGTITNVDIIQLETVPYNGVQIHNLYNIFFIFMILPYNHIVNLTRAKNQTCFTFKIDNSILFLSRMWNEQVSVSRIEQYKESQKKLSLWTFCMLFIFLEDPSAAPMIPTTKALLGMF